MKTMTMLSPIFSVEVVRSEVKIILVSLCLFIRAGEGWRNPRAEREERLPVREEGRGKLRNVRHMEKCTGNKKNWAKNCLHLLIIIICKPIASMRSDRTVLSK